MSKKKRPIIFGEILYDRWPDGTAVLGGAPFNVCRHLRQLGLRPHMLTRIGDDDAGKLLLRELDQARLDPAGVQIDLEFPTGEVLISIDEDGDSTYEIAPDQAWDHIEAIVPEGYEVPAAPPAILYTGSLALRTEAAQAQFFELADKLPCPIFVDVNLRDPWWTRESVDELLDLAFCFKCNEEEYKLLFDEMDPSQFRKDNRLDFLLLTRGAKGMSLYTYRGSFHADPPRLDEPIADTIGAGDAASAVCIQGYLSNWHPKKTLQEATKRAAEVCLVKGAALPDTFE